MSLPTKVNVTRPESQGYDILIEYGDTDAESLYLRAAVGPGRQMAFQTVEPQQRNPDTASNPEDMRAETGESFSRSDFTGGEGLDRAHRRNGTERDFSRFWDSRGVDVTPGRAGSQEKVTLLHDTASIRTAATDLQRQPLATIGTVLYAVASNDTLVDRTADPTAGTPTWTTEDPGGTGTIRDIAALGDELYAAQGATEIRKRSSAGSWAAWSSLNAVRVWAVKGRIVGSDGTGLYEAGDSADTLLETLASGESWTDVVDGGSAILAAATDGNIYAFVDNDGTLTLETQQNIFLGEYPTALAQAAGIAFVATAEDTSGGGKIGRLYRGVVSGLNIKAAQLLKEWGDGATTLDRAPHRIIGTRDAILTGVVESATETHLWRYHLATGGLVRDLVMADTGICEGLAVIDDRVFASVFEQEIYRETTTFVDEGWLIGPLADFFNAAPKTWVGARLATAAVPTTTTAVLAYTTDPEAIEDEADASWTTIITATNAAPGLSAETAITGVEARYLAGKLVLTPNGANTAGPEVLSYTFRGLPLPTERDYQLPVNISDRLERPFRKPILIPGLGDTVRGALGDLIGKSATVTLLRPDESVKGQIRGVSEPVNELPEKGSPSVFALMTVRGQRQ